MCECQGCDEMSCGLPDCDECEADKKPLGNVVAHVRIDHELECGHYVTCGCGHEIGAQAYCWVCAENRTVTATQTVDMPEHRTKLVKDKEISGEKGD